MAWRMYALYRVPSSYSLCPGQMETSSYSELPGLRSRICSLPPDNLHNMWQYLHNATQRTTNVSGQYAFQKWIGTTLAFLHLTSLYTHSVNGDDDTRWDVAFSGATIFGLLTKLRLWWVGTPVMRGHLWWDSWEDTCDERTPVMRGHL